MTIALTGKMSGTADKHTADSLKASFENAWFAAARGAFERKISAWLGYNSPTRGQASLIKGLRAASGES